MTQYYYLLSNTPCIMVVVFLMFCFSLESKYCLLLLPFWALILYQVLCFMTFIHLLAINAHPYCKRTWKCFFLCHYFYWCSLNRILSLVMGAAWGFYAKDLPVFPSDLIDVLVSVTLNAMTELAKEGRALKQKITWFFKLLRPHLDNCKQSFSE